MRSITVIAHNIRSTHNVGSLFRTADSFAVEKIIFSGYTPYPRVKNDSRLPHVYRKMDTVIAKTALGAEKTVPFAQEEATDAIHRLKQSGYRIVALEQVAGSIPLIEYEPPENIVLIIGEEVEGINETLLSLADDVIEIPMFGAKESLNVSVATGIALYHLRTSR